MNTKALRFFLILFCVFPLIAKAESMLDAFNLFFPKLQSLECLAEYTTKFDIDVEPAKSKIQSQSPNLTVQAVWFADGRYSYLVTFPQTPRKDSFRCIFDGTRYSTIAFGGRSMLTTGSRDQKFHLGVMTGIAPLFEPLRCLRLTNEAMTIEENDLRPTSAPLALLKPENPNIVYNSEKKELTVDFKAKDGHGCYIASYRENALFPSEVKLIKKDGGNLISSCEVKEMAHYLPGTQTAFDYPRLLVARSYTNGKLSKEVEVVIKDIKINDPNASDVFNVDRSKINFVGDSDSNTVVPVGK